MLDGPGSEPDPCGSVPDRTSPSRTEREPNTLRKGTGAGPKTELSGSDWAGAGPAAKPGHLECDSDMLGLPSGRRLLARTRDSVPSVLPNGPCSDGFVMNRLEEGALGDPVLAGNLVFNPDGRR